MNAETDDETAQCPYCDGIFRGPKDTDPLRKHLDYCFPDEDWEQWVRDWRDNDYDG